jgi:hypothetical protein
MICKYIKTTIQGCLRKKTKVKESDNYEAVSYDCNSCSNRKQILIRRKGNAKNES